MRRTTLYLDENKINRLKKLANEKKISISDIIRLAIDELLKKDDLKIFDKQLDYKDIIGIAESSEANNISEKVEEYLIERFRNDIY
jgi:hypothetical protein